MMFFTKIVLLSGLLTSLPGRTLSMNDPSENAIPDEKVADESASQKQIRAYVESLKTEPTSGSGATNSFNIDPPSTNSLPEAASLPVPSKKEEFLIDVPLHRAINIRFHTQTSQFKTHQNYLSAEPGSETVQTFVPPNRYVHRIHKPIVHELHEVIQPYHRQFRHIKPVQEYSATKLYSPQYSPSESAPLEVVKSPSLAPPPFTSGSASSTFSDSSIFPTSGASLSLSDNSIASESSTSAIHDSSQNLKGDIEMDKIIARILQNYRIQNTNPLRSLSSLSNPIIVNRFVLKQTF